MKDTNRVATKGAAAIADYIALRLQLPGTSGAEPKHSWEGSRGSESVADHKRS